MSFLTLRVAVMAAPELDSLKFLVALAFSGDAQAMAVETALTLVTDQARMSTRCRSMVGWLRMRHRGQGYDDTSSLARYGSSGK
jgi:hypothetical protein